MNRKQQQVIDYLLAENRVLRELLGQQRLRLSAPQKRRLAAKAKSLGFRRLRELAQAARPQTRLKWYRTWIGRKYEGTANRGAGRPACSAGLRELVVRLVRENRGWGYTRLPGALAHLGHAIGWKKL